MRGALATSCSSPEEDSLWPRTRKHSSGSTWRSCAMRWRSLTLGATARCGPTARWTRRRTACAAWRRSWPASTSACTSATVDRGAINGPTGYGLHRLLTGLGRAGELTAVWVPDTAPEAMRGLVRARAAAARDVGTRKRQVSAFLLRPSRLFPRKKNWGARYRGWLQEQSFEHPADQIVLQELLEAVRLGEERRGRIERATEEFLPSWGLAPIVEALQALRGIELVTAR